MTTTTTIQPRIQNAAVARPDAMEAMLALSKAALKGDVPHTTHVLVHLRASQINGCSVCVEMHSRELRDAGVPEAKLWSVATWREAPYFDESERAALALAEAATRLSDRPDPVPDEVWHEAADHYDEAALTSLVLSIAVINAWNRLNVTTRQPAGAWA
jgi:AhpD family alkylhydroperoxidase